MNAPQTNYIDQKSNTGFQAGIGELENSKIIRSIWKNTFDKILEIKISNKRTLKGMKEQIMVEEKKKIEQKYKKDYNDTFVEKKIEVSTAKNESNLKKMNTKNELVNQTVEETLTKLKAFAKPDNNEYQKLLKELTIECMVKLLENECYLKVRKEDVGYMKSILKECESEYANLMKKETKREYGCKLLLIEDDFIEDEYGGVVMMNKDKKIIINNGLKDRLMLTKERHLPEIKHMLFPKKINKKNK
jgi:V-type H+-transporting ATPase subunit E